jgi:hypothetical protein
MHPSRHSYTLRRAQTITVHHTSDGYVNVFDRRGFGQTVLPELTWAGTGGYWNPRTVRYQRSSHSQASR